MKFEISDLRGKTEGKGESYRRGRGGDAEIAEKGEKGRDAGLSGKQHRDAKSSEVHGASFNSEAEVRDTDGKVKNAGRMPFGFAQDKPAPRRARRRKTDAGVRRRGVCGTTL